MPSFHLPPLRIAFHTTGWSRATALGLAYFLSAQLGSFFNPPSFNFTVFWPPSGVYVAALLLSEMRHWPALVFGSLVANVAFDLSHGRPLWVSLLFWLGNSLEALTGAWLVRRYVAPQSPAVFTRVRHVLGFVVCSPIVSTMLSATLGAFTLQLAFGAQPYGEQWLAWWTGDMVGVLAVAPFILAWTNKSMLTRPPRRAEAAIVFSALMLVACVAFAMYGVLPFALGYVILPLVVWAALRFEVRGAATANLLVALFAVGFTSRGLGQFAHQTASASFQVFSLQSYLGIVSFTALILATLQTERIAAEAALVKANQHLTRSVAELEQRNRDIALLNELGELLQACQTAEEAYAVIALTAQKIFPEYGGWLALLEAAPPRLRRVAEWNLPPQDDLSLLPDDCWALRRGRMHWADAAHPGPLCPHLESASPTTYLCLPLMALRQPFGLLHLRPLVAAPMAETTPQLAVAVIESVELAFANLKLRETLREQAIRDPLTGLYNRRYMEEMLAHELHQARREDKPVGLIMLDLDHFKDFNDTYGHAMGDRLLGALGGLLQLRIRRSDVACRYGGEEFLIILPGSTLEATHQHAEDLRLAVKQMLLPDDHQLVSGLSVSLGIAQFPEHGVTPEEVVDVADAALYRAKREGRDRVVVGQDAAL